MVNSLIELRRISKVFRHRGGLRASTADVAALSDVSLTIAHGEIVSLVGQSGAGKTTLGRILLGLERPDSGEVWFDGQDLFTLTNRQLRKTRQRMHLMFQDPYASLHPGMRVAAVVGEPLAIAGLSAKGQTPRVQEALEEVDLSPATSFMPRYPHELSGGQRQRVALARALVGRPLFIVADEPTSMLDVSLRAGVLNLLQRIRERHDVAVLVITHDLAVAQHVSDRIAVLFQGRIVESGATGDVVAAPLHPYTRALLDAAEHFTPPAPARGAVANGEGCPYRDRCPHEVVQCRIERPDLNEIIAGRHVACHRVGKSRRDSVQHSLKL